MVLTNCLQAAVTTLSELLLESSTLGASGIGKGEKEANLLLILITPV